MTPDHLEEQIIEALRPAKNRLLTELGYEPDSLPTDTHVVLTTSPFGRNYIEVDTGAGDADRHYLAELTDRQHAALQNILDEARSTPPHYNQRDHADFYGGQP